MADAPYQLKDVETRYLSLLLGMIENQNWQAFGSVILDNPRLFQSFARKISRLSELNGMTILHSCVRWSPPAYIVKMLLDLVPESPSCVDCLQRTPLHVAVGTRSSSSVIKLLAEASPEACAIQDMDGKTPLHMACDNECELFESEKKGRSARGPPSYDVVLTLIRASPLSLSVEDDEGMSALEHAIVSEAPIKVVMLLQKHTRRQCVKQQKDNEPTKSSTPFTVQRKIASR